MTALGRRAALLGFAGGAGFLLPASFASATGTVPTEAIRRPDAPGPVAFMRRAEDMRDAALAQG